MTVRPRAKAAGRARSGSASTGCTEGQLDHSQLVFLNSFSFKNRPTVMQCGGSNILWYSHSRIFFLQRLEKMHSFHLCLYKFHREHIALLRKELLKSTSVGQKVVQRWEAWRDSWRERCLNAWNSEGLLLFH